MYLQNIFSNFLCFAIFSSPKCDIEQIYVAKKKRILQTLKYHEITVTVLKFVLRISEKRGRGQLPKIASFKSNAKCKHVVSLYGIFDHYYVPFHVKDVDCVKDLIKLNRWQN